jgi:hypothetical protein
MLLCVPVKLILVKFDVIVYPILAEIPVVVLNLNVVPDGGFTSPTVIRSVVVGLNPLMENPLAS